MSGMLVLALLACGAGAAGEGGSDGPEDAPLRVEAPTPIHDAGGLRLERQAWSAGGTDGVAFRASVALPGRAAVSPAPAVVPFPGLLPSDAGPWAAVNGGFYDRDGAPMGLMVGGGVERAPLRRGGGSGVFVWGPEGPRVVHRDAWTPGAPEALQSIDRLVDGGRSLVNAKPGAHRDARSAVAVGGGRLWLVAMVATESLVDEGPDGARLRRTAGRGATLAETAAFLVGMGATEALNLDGAVSTSLAVRAGDVAWALRGERGTVAALVVRPGG